MERVLRRAHEMNVRVAVAASDSAAAGNDPDASVWRRSRDSNPGYQMVYVISNHARSARLRDFSVLFQAIV